MRAKGTSLRIQIGAGWAVHFVLQLLQKLSALLGAQLTLQLLQSQGHDVVVVRASKLGVGGDVEPKPMHEFDVLGAHAWRMRPEGKLADGSVRGANLHDQPRTRLRQPFPSVAREFRLLVSSKLVGESADHSAGIEALRRDHDGFEDVGRGHNEQGDRLAFFFGDRDSCCKKFLFVVIENLARFEDRTATETVLAMIEAGAHDHDVLLAGVGMTEHMPQVVEVARITDRDQDIARPNAHGAAAEFLITVNAELVELLGLAMTLLGDMVLGDGEDREEDHAEDNARDRGLVLGEQIHNCGHEEHRRNDHEAHGNFRLPDVQMPRNFPCAVARLGEAQHQHRQRLHGEAPDHSEGIQRGQLVDVAPAQHDGEQLHAYNQVDDAVAGAVAVVRLLKPAGEHTIFGHAVQDAIRAHDGSVLRARQNQYAHQHHEAVEQQLQGGRPHQIHGDAADEVGEVLRADAVRDDHHRKERNQRGEQQAVDEDHQPGLLQILQFGVFDFAVDLSQRLFAAHRQHRVSEANECNDRDKSLEREMPEPGSVQPAQRLFVQGNHARVQRVGGQLDRCAQDRDRTPDDQNHHHHGGDGHNLQRLLAGLVNALGVLPPEVDDDDDGQSGGKVVIGKIQVPMQVLPAKVLDKPRQVLPRRNRADGTRQDVVEQQGRDRELGQGPAHGLFDDAVDAAPHEHAAGLDVESPNGVAEQHDREYEPGSALADDLLGVAAGVVGRRGQIRQNNRGRAPERDEGQHHRRGNEDLYCRFCTLRGGSHASDK